MFHLRMVSPEKFAAIRDHFVQVGYTEEEIRQRFQVKPSDPLNLVNFCTKPSPKADVTSSLDAVVHLMLVGEALPVTDAVRLIPPPVWEALRESELILVESTEPARCVASVSLFPVRGLHLAADRWTNIDHSVRTPFPDIVYPPMTKTAAEYLDYTSFEPCEEFLEICAGGAPAALLAAKNAKQVWAADITERSLAFAKFNAALNGIRNVKFALGDLFHAVEGQTFDRIAAHPPYMPTLKPTQIFSGGGELGEDLAKRIVAELPSRLRPGGRFYCRGLGTDREDHGFEQTVREWLGEHSARFDVGLFVVGTVSPNRFALEDTLTHGGGREEARRWEKLFEENGVTQLLNAVLVLEHIADKRPAFTLRRTMPSGTPAAALEWALRWEVEVHSKKTLEDLVREKPVALSGADVTARHKFKDGGLVPEEFRMSVKRPFEVDWRVQPWMPLLLPECDGKKTVSEIFELAKKNDWILPATPLPEFCGVIATLISGGFMQTQKFRGPEGAG